MFIESKTWGGYPIKEMVDVFSHVVNLGFKSPVAPSKPKRVAAETNQIKGVVKFYNVEKSFGFITTKGADLYFHLNSVMGPDTTYIIQGDRVTLKIGVDKRGRTCAKDVRLV